MMYRSEHSKKLLRVSRAPVHSLLSGNIPIFNLLNLDNGVVLDLIGRVAYARGKNGF